MGVPVPSGESNLLARIIESLPDPVFVKDRSHRWIFFNAAFIELLGRPREQLLHKSDYDYFPKRQADVFWRQDELVFSTGRDNVNEETLTDAAGRTHVLVTRKSLWTSPTGEPHVIGMIRDITEIVAASDDVKRSQERLYRAQKLETISHLAGGVAHDFNNLLTAISGYATILLEDLPDDHPARSEAEEIVRAGRRAAALTGRLLSFSRRPSGLARPVSLRTVVEGMRGMIRRLLSPDVELDFVLPNKLSCVRVDPGLVEQILLNLTVNAGEAMPSGGRTTIELAEAPDGGADLKVPCVRLTVRDDGPGMTEKVRKKIFDPFFTTKEKGSGLGLSTVAESVRSSKGAMTVESRPGDGAAFHVYWPAVAELPESPAESAAPRRAEAPRGRRVLIVDDDEIVRRFAVRCLEREGYEVLSAGDSSEAMRICEANDGLFDLLVIDVVMPRMRGPELAAQLRRRQPTARVVFTSGRRREDCCLPDDESVGFLPKPYTAQELSLSASPRAAAGPSRPARRRGRARSRRTKS